MEFAMHAERTEVEFETFAFNTELVRLIVEDNSGEIWLPGYGTEAGEFRTFNMNCPHYTRRIRFRAGKRAGERFQ
jgi:hypothetical protein